ncbi:hypothetical protein ACFWOT_33395 [Streptomyces sp. NPDC058440]|uniref:hypothetical protein n=1 Tax=Streptomyces sp. NPDC058440 TaxID=3346501 RepID=UPI00366895B5
MAQDKLAEILARAAEGDPETAAQFMRTRALRIRAADHFRESGRAAALRMIRKSL